MFRGEAMTSDGSRLIEATARALLRDRIEATPWFRIRMTQKQRQAAIEKEVEAYWHLFITDAADQLAREAGNHKAHDQEPHEKSDEEEAASKEEQLPWRKRIAG
jgi:hypothetical protein